MSAKTNGTPKRINRFVYFFLTPWWRLAWFLFAIAWCVALNAFFILDGGVNHWAGVASVVPLIAFVVNQFARDRHLKE